MVSYVICLAIILLSGLDVFGKVPQWKTDTDKLFNLLKQNKKILKKFFVQKKVIFLIFKGISWKQLEIDHTYVYKGTVPGLSRDEKSPEKIF